MFIVLNAFICIKQHGHRCSKENSYVHLKCFPTERRFLVLICHYFDLQIIKFNTLMNINGIQAITTLMTIKDYLYNNGEQIILIVFKVDPHPLKFIANYINRRKA